MCLIAGKNKFSTGKIVAIVVPIAVCLILLILGSCCFLSRRAKKKHNAVEKKMVIKDELYILQIHKILFIFVIAYANVLVM